MKKSNFIALIFGTIGVIFFALGMCMATIAEWGVFRQGIVCGVIGLASVAATALYVIISGNPFSWIESTMNAGKNFIEASMNAGANFLNKLMGISTL